MRARANIAQGRVFVLDNLGGVSRLTAEEAVTLGADLMNAANIVLRNTPRPEHIPDAGSPLGKQILQAPDLGLGPGETSPFEHGDGSTHTAAKLRQCNAELQASHDPEDGGW